MYLEFFKFSRKPFGSDPDPDFFYQTASTRKVYDRIVKIIRQQELYVLLTGGCGAGKTALLKSLMADAGLMIHWIFIDLTMEFSPHDNYSGYLFDRIKEKIIGFDSIADFQAIIIDGANRLDNKMLQKLLKLQTLNQKKGVAFTIIFVGNPGVGSTPVDTDHGNFATHPNYYNFNLKAFTYQETRAAIGYRLKSAGYQGPEIFKSAALKLIYQLSGGIPGTVFHICELALFLTDYHRQPEVTPQFVRKASRYLFDDKDAHNGKELSPEHPLIDPSRAGPAQAKSVWQVSMWRGAVAGLLILLGAGAWFLLRPMPTHKPQDIRPTLTTQPPSKDSLEHTKQTVVSPESSFQVTATEIAPLATAKPNSQVVEAELDSSQLTVEVRPEQTPPELLLLENLPPPAAGFSKSVVPGDYVSEPYMADPMVTQIFQPPPGVKETIIEVQPYSAINDPVLQGDEGEDSIPTLLADEKEPLFHPEDIPMAASVAQTDSTNYNKLNSTDLFHPQIPQIPADIISETPPAIAQILTKQLTPVPNGKELQASPEVSTQARKKVVAVPPQSQKPDSPTKIHLAAIPPEPPRTLPTTQSTKTTGRAIKLPNGGNLVNAAGNGQLQEVLQLLEDGVEGNSINDTGETALMRAAWFGHTNILTLLLNHEPRVNQQSPEGWTALFYGAVKGHKFIVATLLAQGAKPDVADLDGRTPLMAATWNGHTEIARLLLDSNVDPNRTNRDGWSSLMFAALKGDTDVARILLLHGADPTIKNNEGNTCTQLADHQGHDQFVSLVSSHNALR
jgi:ankyrin repeat protein/type II secretory pathway predicted ATPase ExeA